MEKIRTQLVDVHEGLAAIAAGSAVDVLEAGQVLFMPELAFVLSAQLLMLLATTALLAKNLSFDVGSGVVRGMQRSDGAYGALREAMSAFAEFSRRTVTRLLPEYEKTLQMGRTSYRPAQIEGRCTSWRKDDTRLHVDSFPATPVHGRRILRFFSNVDPSGGTRRWRIAEPLPQVAPRFLPRLRAPVPGSSALLAALKVTKSRRTPYDHYMLQLHDAMKLDGAFQSGTAQRHFDFPAGSSWLVFTDVVPHAAMAGQHAFEQTFYLPVEGMREPARSPQHLLAGLLDRRMV